VRTRINYKIVPVTIGINIDTTVQVELNNMYINIGANNGSKKSRIKKKTHTHTTTSGKLIKAVYDSYVYVYIFWYKFVRSVIVLFPICWTRGSRYAPERVWMFSKQIFRLLG